MRRADNLDNLRSLDPKIGQCIVIVPSGVRIKLHLALYRSSILCYYAVI